MTRIAILAVAAATLLGVVPATAQTLHEALAQAYATNPQLAAARARQEAVEETPEQARAAGRLTSTATGSGGYDQLNYGRSASAVASATLPIWTGGRVRSAVRAATGDVAAGAEGLRDTEAAILQNVVTAYANLLYNEQAVQVARVGIKRLDQQVAEARSRFDLGQSTQTDVAQLEAQRASVVANLADAEGARTTAAAAYRATVGQDAARLSDEVPPTALPQTLAKARALAIVNNPIVRQQWRIVEASEARIDQARTEGAPSLDLDGSYGRGGRLAAGDVIGFIASASAGLTLRVPLLTGGLVSSRVRQAEATVRAERFQADAAEREARRAVDTAWASLTAAQEGLEAATSGLAAADLALKGVRAEYGFGLRSTIDILVADQSYRAAQLSVASARTSILVAQAALLRSTGTLRPDAYG